jgi:protein-S-isoprenylcysteine O-methyltransferase Ste14
MAVTAWQTTLALLLFVCLASFAWGMQRFFVQPSGSTPGMKLISGCGVVFGALHFVAIFVPNSISTERGYLGALLYIWSAGLFWWAIKTNAAARLSAAFSDDLPVHLVEEGPYRFIRHPFYCSYVLAWLAGTIATARWWLLPTVVVMVGIYWRAARTEEAKFSRSSKAAEYENYRARTALLVPNPMKLLMARRSQVRI